MSLSERARTEFGAESSNALRRSRSSSIQADLSGLAKEIGVGQWSGFAEVDPESLESVLRALHKIDPELVSIFIKQKGAELAFGNWESDLVDRPQRTDLLA